MKIKVGLAIVLSVLFMTVTVTPAIAEEGISRDSSSVRPLLLDKGRGSLKKARFWFEDSLSSNTSTDTWVDLFNVDLKLKGKKAQCIKITYSGEFSIQGSSSKQAVYRIVVDGNPIYDSFVTSAWTRTDQFTMVDWACGLSSGGATHNIMIQHHLQGGAGDESQAGQRKLIIEYKK